MGCVCRESVVCTKRRFCRASEAVFAHQPLDALLAHANARLAARDECAGCRTRRGRASGRISTNELGRRRRLGALGASTHA